MLQGNYTCVPQLLSHNMWNLPGPGIESTSPALARGLLITESAGKSRKNIFKLFQNDF